MQELLREGWELTLLKRRNSLLSRLPSAVQSKVFFRDLEALELDDLFVSGKFDTIIHCATNYGRTQTDPLGVVEANLMLPLRLLLKAIEHGVPTFVNTDTILDKGISSYSLSKSQFVDWMKALSQSICCINFRLEHFYGPDDDPSKFVTFIIRELIQASPKIDLTPGEQKRDFIFIDDVVSAFTATFKARASLSNGLHSFDVGSGEKIRLKEFVEKVYKASGSPSTKLNFGALSYRPNEVMDTPIDVCVLKKLGWAPQVSLEEGLARTIEFEKTKRKKL